MMGEEFKQITLNYTTQQQQQQQQQQQLSLLSQASWGRLKHFFQ
jgi:hypothetical protein